MNGLTLGVSEIIMDPLCFILYSKSLNHQQVLVIQTSKMTFRIQPWLHSVTMQSILLITCLPNILSPLIKEKFMIITSVVSSCISYQGLTQPSINSLKEQMITVIQVQTPQKYNLYGIIMIIKVAWYNQSNGLRNIPRLQKLFD